MSAVRSILLGCVIALSGCAATAHKAVPTDSIDSKELSGSLGSSEYAPGEQPPVMLSIPEPKYPKKAAKAGTEGKVVVNMLVGRDGRVKRTKILQGTPGLNAAAASVARRALFAPARKDGKAVEVWVQIPIIFKLRRPAVDSAK